MMTQRPNILFFFPDQHRSDWLGLNPDLPLRTPAINRLANRGVRFTNAFTPSPLCAPARACLATGRDYERCGVKNNGQITPLHLPTYYRLLRDAGYEVVGAGKFDLHKPVLDWGLDGSNMLQAYGFTGGMDTEGKGDAISAYVQNGRKPKGPYMQFLHEQGLAETHYAMYAPYIGKPDWLNFPAVTSLPDHAYCDNWVAAKAMKFLRDFSKDKPWHLVVNWVGPHGPFDVTQDMRSRWAGVDIPGPHENHELDKDVIRDRRQNYAAMIENIDRCVGEMIRLVEERGELDNTLIVYASDHGEMLGDHGRWGKSLWHTPSAGVPLILAGPGILPGRSSDALVSLHDLAATFLHYASVSHPPGMDSLSLRPLLEGKTAQHRDHVLCGLNAWRMIVAGHYKLVMGTDASPLLLDLENDPLESRNVASNHPELVDRLTQALESGRKGPNQTDGGVH